MAKQFEISEYNPLTGYCGPERCHLSAIDYHGGSRIQNLGIWSGIDGIRIVESEGRSGKSGTDVTGARFGVGIGRGIVGTGIG